MDAASFCFDDLANWPETGGRLDPPVRLSVFGDPVAHSLSPHLHNPALAASGIRAQYVRLLVRPGAFSAALRRIHDLGFIGTNVTIPHKFSALQAVDVVDAQARRLGAVNTVVFRDGRAFGSNSDGPGFVRSVREAFCAAVGDLRVLILGAGGGAGRAVAVQCALENCRHLTLVNRTPEKSAALAGEIAGFFPKNRLSVADWSGEALRRALPQVDLIINGTNLGMKPEDPPVLPQGCLEARHLVHDMVYRPAVTPLVAMARDAGASAVNGLPMLLHQGAVSFESWFSQPAPLEIMRQSLWAAAGVPP
ncbi:MAG: shikimate dehydrogenase [Verrucomicrobiales bacterium]|nr:shikimate dehydrogenase [Verrucomicrobiales bacterium]